MANLERRRDSRRKNERRGDERREFDRGTGDRRKLDRRNTKRREDDKKKDDEDEFYSDQVEGRNAVIELLESGKDINKLYITKGEKNGSINKIIAMAKEKSSNSRKRQKTNGKNGTNR